MIFWVFIAGTIVASQVIVRRTFVEVSSDGVRWFYRVPRQQGEEPLANLIKVERYASGAFLFFNGGAGRVAVSRSDFSNSEINRVVETLRGLGARVVTGQQ